jgi:hypothetical protein
MGRSSAQDEPIRASSLSSLGAAIIRPCLQYFLKRWIGRNGSLHGGTQEEQEDKKRILRSLRIDVYAEVARRIRPIERKLLIPQPSAALKKLAPVKQKNWLAFAHALNQLL